MLSAILQGGIYPADSLVATVFAHGGGINPALRVQLNWIDNG
jgi:hypothetical protein